MGSVGSDERWQMPRLWNIGGGNFLDAFLTHGSKAEADYARHNTVYLIGQYLCWSEILRREAQLVDPVDRRRDRDIAAAMETIRDIMADSHTYRDAPLRVFRGDQRHRGGAAHHDRIAVRPDRAALGLHRLRQVRQGSE
jgi:hypothetical protein